MTIVAMALGWTKTWGPAAEAKREATAAVTPEKRSYAPHH